MTRTIFLRNKSTLTVQKQMAPAPMFGVRWKEKLTLLCYADHHVLELTMPSAHQEFESAALAGAELESFGKGISFALYLFLAFLSLKRTLPDKREASQITEIAVYMSTFYDIPFASYTSSDEEINEVIWQTFRERKSEALPVLRGHWNMARFLLLCGEAAWQLEGEEASFWGSFPSDKPLSEEEDDARMQRGILAKLAWLAATPQMVLALPLPLAKDPVPEFIWWDWVALASGPSRPDRALRPGGLGEFRGSPLETNLHPSTMALSVEHAQALTSLIRTLLQQAERPYPRYLGRILSVRLPLRLLPLLRGFGIEQLIVQVEATGLYLSVLDRGGGCIGAAWWGAAYPSERTPMVFPASAWTVILAIVAAFWKDLCSNAIVVGPKQSLLTSGNAKNKTPRKKKKRPLWRQQRLYLPPVRYKLEQASWADTRDQERIHRTTKTAHWYRILHTGWQDREERPDFQQRRTLAIARAREAGQPDPPRGFTFVHRLSTDEPRARSAEKEAPQSVHAQGLFALSLVLQEQAIGVSTKEEER